MTQGAGDSRGRCLLGSLSHWEARDRQVREDRWRGPLPLGRIPGKNFQTSPRVKIENEPSCRAVWEEISGGSNRERGFPDALPSRGNGTLREAPEQTKYVRFSFRMLRGCLFYDTLLTGQGHSRLTPLRVRRSRAPGATFPHTLLLLLSPGGTGTTPGIAGEG